MYMSDSIIPVLSVAGLNIEEVKKTFIKGLMVESLKKQIPIYIQIIPEPSNSYDSNAIKVMLNDFHIGYIPKEDQKYFDFSSKNQYTAHIVSWGVLKDSSAYVYIQPVLKI